MGGEGDEPIKKAKPCKICSGFGEMFERTKDGTHGAAQAGPAAHVSELTSI